MHYRTVCPSPLGPLTLESDGAALTGLWMEGQRYFGRGAAVWEERDDLPLFDATRAWLAAYFAGRALPLPPLAPKGTDFQRRVWQALLEIPAGERRSYAALAAHIGCASARAVGAAVGRNPISILIPCHRVVGADGSLTGYAGGLERKKWLLQHECVKTVV